MDLKLNLLWHLGRYELVLVPFAEVLAHSDTVGHRDELWSIVLDLLQRKRLGILEGDREPVVAGDTTPWNKVRQAYAGMHKEKRIIEDLMLHARILSAYTSHGDAPWNGVVRLIDQDFEERKYLGELPGGTRLQLVMDQAAPL